MATSIQGKYCPPPASGCLFKLAAECIFYSGNSIPSSGINTGDSLNVVIQKLATGNTVEPMKYVALLTQTGTGNPTAVTLENTLGNIVWTRTNPGEYTGMLTGAFPQGKTVLFSGPYNDLFGPVFPALARASNDDIVLHVFNFSNAISNCLFPQDGFEDYPIEIRVYP